VFLPGRFERYAEVSRHLHVLLKEYTPLVEGISLDEAFLDVTGAARLFGSGPDIGAAIRRRVASGLGLACSVGVAPVKFLAKLASEAAKPHATLAGVVPGSGVVVIEPGQELAFLHPLPIEALWGVGPATAQRLRRLGVTTVGALAAVPPDVLEAAIGAAHGRQLGQLAQGIDTRGIDPDRPVKSVSHEETYPVDIFDRAALDVEIVRMADAVANRLRRAGVVGRTVGLKVRYGDFVTLTRSRTSSVGLSEGPSIVAIAMALLDTVDVSPGVRLLGVGVSNLTMLGEEEAEQMRFDLQQAPAAHGPSGERAPADPEPGLWRRASGAVDAVRERFGVGAVGPATLLGPGGLHVKRPGDTQWGPSAPAAHPDSE
jgi:DNA polymerase-4